MREKMFRILSVMTDFSRGVHTFGRERRVVYTLEQLVDLVLRYSGRKYCLVSLYPYSTIVGDSPDLSSAVACLDLYVSESGEVDSVPPDTPHVIFEYSGRVYTVCKTQYGVVRTLHPLDTLIPIPETVDPKGNRVRLIRIRLS